MEQCGVVVAGPRELHLAGHGGRWRKIGIELAGANGGEDVRVAGVVGEGGLGVGERGVHEHRESVRMLLG